MQNEQKFNVAVIGATGLVGETMLTVLDERQFPIDNLFVVASEASIGDVVTFRKKQYAIDALSTFDFSKVDIALFAVSADLAKTYAPIAVKAGAIVIDNSSHFRYDNDIPLIVPEVNANCIVDFEKRGIIANPNCSTIQMVVALAPLHRMNPIKRIQVVTYQSVSGTGKAAISELVKQVGEMLNGRPCEPEVYPKKIAFNVIPQIDAFEDNDYTREEMKMVWETRKIIGDDTLLVNPTTVRVPVLFGHSMAIHIDFSRPFSAVEARKILAKADGVTVLDNPKKGAYPTPLEEGSGKDEVFVGRIRQDISSENGLNLWVVADNIRKGAATNAVQIADILIKLDSFLIKKSQ
jgi:aspartate-semialdehyde dehydrogenase